MNGADVPETGSKMSETTAKGTEQFPGSKESPKHKPKHKPEHKTSSRILSYNEFVKDSTDKFNKQTIEKTAMSGEKTGDKGVATLESETIDEAVTKIKKFEEFIEDKNDEETPAEGEGTIESPKASSFEDFKEEETTPPTEGEGTTE